MSARSAVAAGRRAAEARMVDSCTIRRVSGLSTNATTGAATPTYTAVYAGVCEVQEATQAARGESAGGPVTVGQRVVKIPVGAATVAVGDEVLIGSRLFRVADVHLKTWQTAQRLPVEELL